MADDVTSVVTPGGHLLVTVNGATVDMGSITHPITAGDSYLGYIAKAIQAIDDFNNGSGSGNGASNASIAQFVLSSGDTQIALDSRYASTAQGILASSAVQPGSLSDIATSGSYNDLLNKPTITTPSWVALTGKPTTFPPTIGTTATTALAGNTSLFSGVYTDLSSKPTLGSAAAQDITAFATAAQGTLATNAVPSTRTINTKPLSANVVLAASDITTGVLPVAQTPVATTSTAGAVKLAGDLAGTSALPSVAKVNGVAVTGTPTAGQAIVATSGTAAAWSNVTTSVTDSAVAAVIDSTATKAKLDATYVKQSNLVAAPITFPGYHQDTLIVPPGSVSVTLGADPLPGSLMVFSGGQSINPTLSGRVLTFPAMSAENKILYAYDQNQPEPGPLGSPLHIYDSFDRANSATTMYRTESGQVWTVPVNAASEQPVWGITGNTAYCVDPGASSDAYVYTDAGVADCVVQFKIGVASSSFGPYIRASNASNGYTSNTTRLYQRVAGVTSNASGWNISYPTAFATGDTIRVVCSGTNIEVFQDKGTTGNFISMGSNTDNMFTANTKHGFRSNNTTARFDDFHIWGN